MRRLSVAILTLAFAGVFPAIAEAANCRALETQLLQLQVGGLQASEEPRARLLRNRLVESGCRRGTIQPDPEPRRSARERVVRAAPRSAPARSSSSRTSDREARRAVSTRTSSFMKSREGSYRTLCVRSCDGYYFPISFATSRSNFERDAFICSQRCPAAGTQLFYHVAIGESAEDMRSPDGTRYADLPNAFKHRVALDPSCTCGSAGGASDRLAALLQGASAESGAAASAAPAAPPPPLWRPAPGTDPETYANAVGGFEPGRVSSAPPVMAANASGIRLVGPVDDPLELLTPIPTGRP